MAKKQIPVDSIKKLIVKCLDERYADLKKLVHDTVVVTVAAELYQFGVISNGVNSNPTYELIMEEFKAKFRFIRKQDELEYHCHKFIMALEKQGGPLVDAANELKTAWIEVVSCELEITFSIKDKKPIQANYVQDSEKYVPHIARHQQMPHLAHKLRKELHQRSNVVNMAAMNITVHGEESDTPLDTLGSFYTQDIIAEQHVRSPMSTWAVVHPQPHAPDNVVLPTGVKYAQRQCLSDPSMMYVITGTSVGSDQPFYTETYQGSDFFVIRKQSIKPDRKSVV